VTPRTAPAGLVVVVAAWPLLESPGLAFPGLVFPGLVVVVVVCAPAVTAAEATTTAQTSTSSGDRRGKDIGRILGTVVDHPDAPTTHPDARMSPRLLRSGA
jgi:hypothetical protein